MARETMADLRAEIAMLREQLDREFVVQCEGQSFHAPATLREIAQCAHEGTRVTVHGVVGRGVFA